MKHCLMRYKFFFVLCRVFCDLIVIPLSIILAYGVKFKVFWFFNTFLAMSLGKVYPHAQIEPYLQILWLELFIWMGTFYVVGIYRSYFTLMPMIDHFVKLVKANCSS